MAPLICAWPLSQSSLASVRRLIRRETFRNLSSLKATFSLRVWASARLQMPVRGHMIITHRLTAYQTRRLQRDFWSELSMEEYLQNETFCMAQKQLDEVAEK